MGGILGGYPPWNEASELKHLEMDGWNTKLVSFWGVGPA